MSNKKATYLKSGANLWKKSVAVLSLASLYCLFLTRGVSAEGPNISGFVDTTYVYNTNRPATQTNGFRSYDGANNTIQLNNAQVTIEGSLSEGVGYVVETNYGSDAAVNTSGGSGGADDFDIQEAYLTYRIDKTPMPIDIKAGKFVTLQGIEVIESKDNFIITRGFLYGLAEAFTHVGAMATVSAPEVVSLSFGVINGWDLSTDNNEAKSIISRLGLDFGDMLSGGFVFYYGAEKAGNNQDQRFSFDTTWFAKPVDNVTIALQFNAGTEEKSSLIDGAASHWYGFTIQPKVELNDMFGIGARYEYFENLDGDRAPDPNVATRGLILQNITLAPTVNVTESVMFRTEYRYDWASELAFERSDGTFSKGENSTFSAQLIYSF